MNLHNNQPIGNTQSPVGSILTNKRKVVFSDDIKWKKKKPYEIDGVQKRQVTIRVNNEVIPKKPTATTIAKKSPVAVVSKLGSHKQNVMSKESYSDSDSDTSRSSSDDNDENFTNDYQ